MAASRVKTTSDDASIQRLLHGQPGRQAAVTVPTGKLPQGDSPPSPTEMPQLPEEQAARTTGCLPGMKTVVRVAVHERLPAFLKLSVKSLCDLGPFEIDAANRGRCNFKEIWSPENCKISVSQQNMYEAGGTIFWADVAGSMDRGEELALEEVSWKEIFDVEEKMMPSIDKPLYFKNPFPVYDVSANLAHKDTWPAGLRLMRGHLPLLAWYMAMARALVQNDEKRVNQLFNMGMTLTLRAYTLKGQELLLKSLIESESVKIPELADSFQDFSYKVMRIQTKYLSEGDEIKQSQLLNLLQDDGVRFNGASVNKTMLQGALAVATTLDPVDGVKILTRIHREHGRDILSNGYTKLARVTQIASKQATLYSQRSVTDDSVQDLGRSLLQYTLESLYIALKREQCEPS
ncbi:Cdkl4, partial [Symbiodinium natans]